MMNWKYWSWQITRSIPLAICAAALLGTAGLFTLNAFTMAFTASTKIVLERPLDLSGTSIVQRTTAEVQHLQLLIHAMSTPSSETQPLTLFESKIETSRDKPTYLELTMTQPSASQAIDALQSLSHRIQEQSEAIQLKRENSSIAKFQARAKSTEITLTASRETLATHLDGKPDSSLEELRKTSAALRGRLLNSPSDMATNPNLAKLYTELEIAKGVYSDAHPKVRLIRTKIVRAQDEGNPEKINAIFRSSIVRQLELVDVAITNHVKFRTEEQRLTQHIETASTENRIANDNLSKALQAIHSNHIHLKVVDRAGLSGRDPIQVRTTLLALLFLCSMAAGLAVLAMRIKFDSRLRRPEDLYKKLGLTPFATLPDLGPSLG
ncbi:MAG: hypothetical protein ABJN34_05695 [Litoreibacter sp.]|uniref:hypothetical protein n=1 Tax=Litoreibacter sp. TaxID=1969459 RepID=UPI0032982E0B